MFMMRKLVNLSRPPDDRTEIHSFANPMHRASICNWMCGKAFHTFPHLHSIYYE